MKNPCGKIRIYCISESRESVPILIIHFTMHYRHKKAKCFFGKFPSGRLLSGKKENG